MKKQLSFALTLLISINIFSQAIINFPDGKLWSKLVFSTPANRVAKNLSGQWVKVDANNDMQIQITEAQQISELHLRTSEITSMQGVEYFSALKKLDVYSNNLSSLDLNQNALLESLVCDNNVLTSLNINQNSKLNYLAASWNLLSVVALPPNIEKLYLTNNQLSNISTTSSVALKVLRVEDNPITSLSLLTNANLEELNFSNTLIVDINLANNVNLLSLTTNNKLVNLNVSKNINLETLLTSGQNLTTVDVRNGNNSDMLTARFGDATSSPKLRCIYVDWKDSHILTNFWIKPYTATYVNNEQECGLLSTANNSLLQLAIYPNPAQSKLHLLSHVNYVKYEIVNLEGRIVKTGKVINKEIIVDILPKGKYILKLYSNTEVISKPFMKN